MKQKEKIKIMELALSIIGAEGWQTSPIADHPDFQYLQITARKAIDKIRKKK